MVPFNFFNMLIGKTHSQCEAFLLEKIISKLEVYFTEFLAKSILHKTISSYGTKTEIGMKLDPGVDLREMSWTPEFMNETLRR